MTNQWFRLYSEFSIDPKVQMLPEAMQRRLIMLFCSRCNGHVTLRDDEVTFLLRISNADWQETKAIFIAKGFIDSSNNLINWEKRQFRSDSSRERVARHREAKKQESVTACNVTVTPQNRTDTEQIQNRTDTESIVLGVASQNKASTAIEKKINGHSSRGSRLTAEWKLPDEWGEWAEGQGMRRPAILIEEDKFRDYWISKTGAQASKANWEATWRNWIRKHLEEYAK